MNEISRLASGADSFESARLEYDLAVVVQAQPWCAGAYEPSLGTNFGPCPGAVVAH